jgi:hypothetical protein
MCNAATHDRFTPNSDTECALRRSSRQGLQCNEEYRAPGAHRSHLYLNLRSFFCHGGGIEGGDPDPAARSL